jgi:hypothetical protein
MGTLAEIESAIESLSAAEYEQLSLWMVSRHLHEAGEDCAESLMLESLVLEGAQGPFHPLTEETFERIRRRTGGSDQV